MEAKSNVTHEKRNKYKFDTKLITQDRREDETTTTAQKGRTDYKWRRKFLISIQSLWLLQSERKRSIMIARNMANYAFGGNYSNRVTHTQQVRIQKME
jgi:hypothetical protein